MKAEDWVQTIERFSLDILGTIVPGAVFLLPALMLLPADTFPASIPMLPPTGSFGWCVLITLAYVLGHVLTSVGNNIVVPIAPWVSRGRWRIRDEEHLARKIRGTRNFVAFAQHVALTTPSFDLEKSDVAALSQLRNIAMSTIGAADRQTVYKFMFISLLNLGVASAVCLLFAGSIVTTWFTSWRVGIAGSVSLLVVPFLIERRFSFYARSMEVPFSMAIGQLIAEHKRSSGSSPRSSLRSGEHVYLAGGMRSGWQDHVISACHALKFYDPRTHELAQTNAYAAWDFEAIQRSEWLFAYLEEGNPGGYALALEVGYAKALGKRVILVDEKSCVGAEHLDMLHEAADVVAESFEHGLEFLIKLDRLVGSF